MNMKRFTITLQFNKVIKGVTTRSDLSLQVITREEKEREIMENVLWVHGIRKNE